MNPISAILKTVKCSNHWRSIPTSTWSKHTVKLEMFADINVCEFAILKVFALLKFAILVLPKVKFVFPMNSFLLLLLLLDILDD